MLSLIPPPGTPGGPCVTNLCAHAPCENLRHFAGAGCPGCEHPIGYGALFVAIQSPPAAFGGVPAAPPVMGAAHYACWVRDTAAAAAATRPQSVPGKGT